MKFVPITNQQLSIVNEMGGGRNISSSSVEKGLGPERNFREI
jgi:hypothetical protein